MSHRKQFEEQLLVPTIAAGRLASTREFTDTDPQMLHAIWLMEFGVDPDRSLAEVENAIIAYDKFAPGVSKR